MRLGEFLKDKITILLLGWGLMTAISYLALLAVGNGEEWAMDATYLPYDGSIVIAVIVLLLVIRFYGLKSFEGKVWTLITAGLALWMFAELVWGIDVLLYEMGSDSSVPAVLLDNTDYPFLAGYVLIALGFLYKANFTDLKPDSGKAFLVMTITAIFLMISVFVVVQPLMDSTAYTESEKFFMIAYVVLDILLFAIGLAIALYWGTEVSKGWYILSAALLSMMIADIGYTALDLKGIYFDGSLIELAWVGAYLLIGLAGHYQRKLHESFM